MTNKNYQTSVYTDNRPPKQHELQMLSLIQKSISDTNLRVLDIGCADGLFLGHLKNEIQDLDCMGIDLSEELIKRARHNFSQIKFEAKDASNLKDIGKFDIVIASGILSVFENPEEILKNWLSCLNDTGHLFLFGRFNTADIDTIIRFRVGERSAPWEGGWTAFSLKTTREILSELGYTVEFTRFMFDGVLPKSDNPVQTSTIDTCDGERYMICGGNIIAEHYFAVITKDR